MNKQFDFLHLKLTKSLRDMLTRRKSRGCIDNGKYRHLYCSDGLLRAYALPKIHKPECPFRIIISLIGSSFYNLAISLYTTF